MHSIRCGKCHETHQTVDEVRACHGLQDPPKPESVPPIRKAGRSARPSVDLSEGFWLTPKKLDSHGKPCVWKIQRAVHGSGRLYAKQLIILKDGAGQIVGKYWEHAPGAYRMLQFQARKMSVDEAAEFGKLYGFCIICGRTLTDEASIEAGIGPVCASKIAA